MSAAASSVGPGFVPAGRDVGPAAKTWICVLLLAGLLPGACIAAPGPVSLVNRKAPAFALRDLNSKALGLRGFRGKVVLLNFWATWCAPCQLEMPVFRAWQRQYGPQGLQIVGISMDDDPAPAREMVTRMKLNYPVAMGDAALGERYGGVLGLPLTYLIDRNGIVRARFQGETDVNSMEKTLKLILALR